MLDTSVFVSALEFASHAAATKDVRFYLIGALFEFRPTGLELIATDGGRMAHVAVDFEAGNLFADLIVPNASVKTLLTLLKKDRGQVSFAIVEGALHVTGAGQTISVKPIDGKFPDWRRVEPKRPAASKSCGVVATQIAEGMKACGKLAVKGAVLMALDGEEGAPRGVKMAPGELTDPRLRDAWVYSMAARI